MLTNDQKKEIAESKECQDFDLLRQIFKNKDALLKELDRLEHINRTQFSTLFDDTMGCIPIYIGSLENTLKHDKSRIANALKIVTKTQLSTQDRTFIQNLCSEAKKIFNELRSIMMNKKSELRYSFATPQDDRELVDDHGAFLGETSVAKDKIKLLIGDQGNYDQDVINDVQSFTQNYLHHYANHLVVSISAQAAPADAVSPSQLAPEQKLPTNDLSEEEALNIAIQNSLDTFNKEQVDTKEDKQIAQAIHNSFVTHDQELEEKREGDGNFDMMSDGFVEPEEHHIRSRLYFNNFHRLLFGSSLRALRNFPDEKEEGIMEFISLSR